MSINKLKPPLSMLPVVVSLEVENLAGARSPNMHALLSAAPSFPSRLIRVSSQVSCHLSYTQGIIPLLSLQKKTGREAERQKRVKVSQEACSHNNTLDTRVPS